MQIVIYGNNVGTNPSQKNDKDVRQWTRDIHGINQHLQKQMIAQSAGDLTLSDESNIICCLLVIALMSPVAGCIFRCL